MKHVDPTSKITPAVEAFAEKIFDAFDVGEVVSESDAAEATGLTAGTAKQYIAILRAARCWPYRGAWWKTRANAVGPFARLAERRAS